METTPTPPPAAPRWMRVALAASLALNLLVLGIVLGALARDGGQREDRRIARNVAAAPFVMALEPADRRAVIGRLREEPGGLRENRRELRRRFEALLEAIRAESFDRAEVEALLGDQRAAAGMRQEIGERLLLDRIEGMSRAERIGYADRLERSLRRGDRR